MKYALARWCLRLALRLDPELPLNHLRVLHDTYGMRCVGNRWAVVLMFNERDEAQAFESWVVVEMKAKP